MEANDITIDQKIYIEELQEYLRFISFYEKRLPRLFPDGIYGSETEEAVSIFQKLYELPVTGKVDNQTWKRIVEVYTLFFESVSDPRSLQPYPNNAQIQMMPGESMRTVYLLQVMLNSLTDVDPKLEPISYTGVIDEMTVKAIKQIQQYSSLPVTGVVDKPTWNSIVGYYNRDRAANTTSNG